VPTVAAGVIPADRPSAFAAPEPLHDTVLASVAQVPAPASSTPAPRAPARAAHARRPARAPAPSPAHGAIGEGERLLRVAEEQLGQARIAEACATGHLAADAAPQSPAVWEFLGRCHMRLAEPETALSCYRRYLALAPDGPRVPFVKAIVERGAQ
jgi:hypothetical protein